jgi:anthranilate phosphoribosyltransferase
VKTILTRLVGGATLTETEAAEAMLQMMEGVATPAQIAAFLTALRLKGETVEGWRGSCARNPCAFPPIAPHS